MAGFFRRLRDRLLGRGQAGRFTVWFGQPGDVDTGVVVDRETALEIAAVNLVWYHLTTDAGQVPAKVYRRTPNGPVDVSLEDSGPGRLWRYGPNAWQTTQAFVEQYMTHVLTCGDFYARAFYVAGMIDTLSPVDDPTAVDTAVRDGRPWHTWEGRTYSGSRGYGEPGPQMLHVHGPSFDGLRGGDFLYTNRQSLGLARSVYRYGAVFFANNAQPSVILIVPASAKKDDMEAAKARFLAEYGGDAAHGVAVYPAGTDVKQLSVDPEKAQALQVRQQANREIFALFKYPEWRAFQTTPAGATPQARAAYYTDTLRPWLARLSAEVNKHLLPADHYLEFQFAALLQPDTQARFAVYASAVDKRILSPNECRRMENLPGYAGGDEYLNPNVLTGQARQQDTAIDGGGSASE